MDVVVTLIKSKKYSTLLFGVNKEMDIIRILSKQLLVCIAMLLHASYYTILMGDMIVCVCAEM